MVESDAKNSKIFWNNKEETFKRLPKRKKNWNYELSLEISEKIKLHSFSCFFLQKIFWSRFFWNERISLDDQILLESFFGEKDTHWRIFEKSIWSCWISFLKYPGSCEKKISNRINFSKNLGYQNCKASRLRRFSKNDLEINFRDLLLWKKKISIKISQENNTKMQANLNSSK